MLSMFTNYYHHHIRFTLLAFATFAVFALFHSGHAISQAAANVNEKSTRAETSSDAPIELTTSTGIIRGQLMLPAPLTTLASTNRKMSLVIIHAGSGPTDRDGNSAGVPGKNNSLKMLAEALSASDIASVRFDKRGIAKSTDAGKAEKDLRFDNYVEDLSAWVKMMRLDKRFSRIIIAGHSEGSLIGMMAAVDAKADAFISIAGIARSAGDVLRTQLKPRLPPALWDESERVLAALEAGKTMDDAPAALVSLYRPSVQPYLISWLRLRPIVEIAKLTVPVLILQGTTDIQVAVSEAEALKKALPAATLIIIDGMNHVLKTVEIDQAKNAATYSNPNLPINPELVKQTIKFVKSLN